MTVRQLIKKLEAMPKGAKIVVRSRNYELKGAMIDASSVYLEKMKQETETFFDDFDGGSYNKKVWTFSKNKGEKVIIIS